MRLSYTRAMSMPYILHYAPDNASLVIRLAMEEMGVPYQTALVDRSVNAQQSAAYRALNPNGLIPVLETPHGPIFETGAILLWLADTHSAMAPAPSDADRVGFLKWLFFLSNTLHADLRINFYTHLYAGPETAAQTAVIEQVQNRLTTHLSRLDDLAARQTVYLGAAQPSVLDFYLACMMRWMALYPAARDKGWFSLDATPHLGSMLHRLEDRPAVLAAMNAEGLGPTPFTCPRHPQPPEGSAI